MSSYDWPSCPNAACLNFGLPDPVESVTDEDDDNQWVCTSCDTQFTSIKRGLLNDEADEEDSWNYSDDDQEDSEYVPESPVIPSRGEAVQLRSHNRLADLPLAQPVNNVAYIPPLPIAVEVASPPPEEEAQPIQEIDMDPMTAPIDQLQVLYPSFFNPVTVIDLTNE